VVLLLARDPIRKNLSVPADPGCSGVPGFPYSPVEDDAQDYGEVTEDDTLENGQRLTI